ncbi:hypothetical protein SK128_012605, partial [Halocaridina rubra]
IHISAIHRPNYMNLVNSQLVKKKFNEAAIFPVGAVNCHGGYLLEDLCYSNLQHEQ